jgi:hypothetical protein
VGSSVVARFAKSAVESLGTVSIGEDSPVEVGDMSGAPALTGDMDDSTSVSGRATFRCNGEGEESWDEGGVRPPPPFLSACRSPVDRFMVNPR